MYGRGHRHTPVRPTRPRRLSDAVLVRTIVASLRAHPGRPVTDYTQRDDLVALVRDALAKVGHPAAEEIPA